MPGGTQCFPGKEIQAQALRARLWCALMWTTGDQKTEACCIAHHNSVIGQWSSLMCWIQAALPSCFDCSSVVGGCLVSSSCSSKTTCVWVLLILSLISSLHQLMYLEQRCSPATQLLGQNGSLPLKWHSFSFLAGELLSELPGVSCTVCCRLFSKLVRLGLAQVVASTLRVAACPHGC